MGCSFSGLNALYDATNSGKDVWINENRYRIIRQLGEGGFAYVYLVKMLPIASPHPSSAAPKKFKDPSHVSDDGTYAMKKILIQNRTTMKAKKEFFSTPDVLHIFRQLCAGLKHMHSLDPPYVHNDVKPGNVLITYRKGQPPLAILMDFGSARPARKQIRSHSEALQLQEWASEHCSAPFRAPELWDCQAMQILMKELISGASINEFVSSSFCARYGVSPFEYALEEPEGSQQLAIANAQIKWPAGPNPPYPDTLHKFVTWLLQPQATVRPRIDDIIIHVDKLISKFSP
ncbi:hypothetical protein C3L33_04180, partial [Rhododendron williamsianum]